MEFTVFEVEEEETQEVGSRALIDPVNPKFQYATTDDNGKVSFLHRFKTKRGYWLYYFDDVAPTDVAVEMPKGWEFGGWNSKNRPFVRKAKITPPEWVTPPAVAVVG